MICLETPIFLSGKSFISLFISNVTEACYMSSCTQNARGRETCKNLFFEQSGFAYLGGFVLCNKKEKSKFTFVGISWLVERRG